MQCSWWLPVGETSSRRLEVHWKCPQQLPCTCCFPHGRTPSRKKKFRGWRSSSCPPTMSAPMAVWKSKRYLSSPPAQGFIYRRREDEGLKRTWEMWEIELGGGGWVTEGLRSQISCSGVYLHGSFDFSYCVCSHPSFPYLYFPCFFSLLIWSCQMMKTSCCFSAEKLPWTTAWSSCGSVSLPGPFPLHTNSFLNTSTPTTLPWRVRTGCEGTQMHPCPIQGHGETHPCQNGHKNNCEIPTQFFFSASSFSWNFWLLFKAVKDFKDCLQLLLFSVQTEGSCRSMASCVPIYSQGNNHTEKLRVQIR